jgi:hypothetical protein
MGRREEAKKVVNWGELESFKVFGFLEEFLEKGNTRKHTEKRVARWRKLFGGILVGLRCFAKRIMVGEFEMGFF